MVEALFTRSADDSYIPSDHARGPWDPDALHGGAPAALIAREFERIEPGSQPGDRAADIRVSNRSASSRCS